VWAIVVILAVTAVTFAIFYLLRPRSGAALRGQVADARAVAQNRHNLALDKPWYTQNFKFTKNVVTGDKYGWPGLGYSYGSGVPIRDKIIEKAPRTFSLIAGAAVIWLLVGVSIGVISAVKRRTIFDAPRWASRSSASPRRSSGSASWRSSSSGSSSTSRPAPATSPSPTHEQWASHLILP